MDKEPSSTIESQLLTVVQQMLVELKAEQAVRNLSLTANLEHDLGIGSLEKAELIHRIESTFTIQIPQEKFAEVNVLADFISLITQQHPQESFKNIAEKVPLAATHVDPTTANSLVEILLQYAEQDPDRPHIYLQDEHGEEQTITYGDLFRKATQVAQGLLAWGLQAKEPVAIMLPTGEDFFYVFFGILLADGIPVPIYPPLRASEIESYVQREAKILNNAQVRLLITFQRTKTISQLLRGFIPTLKNIMTVNLLMTAPPDESFRPKLLNPYALIQYTSGSTGDPKGVLLSHHNLLANIDAAGRVIKVQPTDIFVSWLPLYHDMGLIGSWLGSFYYGIPVVILSPLTFLLHPERWLWAIHYYRGTISPAPNFAYELCVQKINDKALEGLDLRSWRIAFNGAEMVQPKTMRAFTEKFSAYHFRESALLAAYGLAESTVALLVPDINEPSQIDKVNLQMLEQQQKAIPVTSTQEAYYEFVSCGKPLPEHEVQIVDTNGQVLGEREIGHLQFKGPSTMQGYYHNTQATAAIHQGSWWDTGDLGYQANGLFFITGRIKDLIIIAGRNIIPQEVESIVEAIPGIQSGCVIAFGIGDTTLGTEKLVIVAETTIQDTERQQPLTTLIAKQITENLNITAHHILLVPPKVVPKTASGKLQRSLCKTLFLQGKLSQKETPAWLQISKVFLGSHLRKLIKGFDVTCQFFYTLYAWLIGFLIFFTAFVCVVLLPLRWVKQTTKFLCRLLFRLIGCPFHIEDKQYLTDTWPMIYIANHTSYIDSLVLMGLLPVDTIMVGKMELATSRLFRIFMKKMGYLTVNRFDFTQSLGDYEKIKQRLHEGQAVMLYPEGTFTEAVGLRTFKLGPFKLAIETQTPLCPIGISGTRHILASKHWLLKPERIKINIGQPLTPESKEWAEAIRLRDLARKRIAELSGEKPIHLITAGISGVDE